MKIASLKAFVCGVSLLFSYPLAVAPARAADITPAEARAIAKEAYVYGFPIVDNYRIQHSYFVDRQNPEFQSSLEPNP